MKHSHFAVTCLLFFASAALAADQVPQAKPKTSSGGERGFAIKDSGCGGAGHLADVQCSGRYLDWLDGELDVAYAKAMSKLPARDVSDSRRGQEQLRRSQEAWRAYRQENCALEGALEGGSNLWVTHLAALCEERELRARIEFLRKIEM